MKDLLSVLALFALVGCNAFFVIGEYAVVTARRGPLRTRAAAGSPGAKVALQLMDDPVRVISTVQVGITAVGILSGSVGQRLLQEALGTGIPGWLGFVIAFAVVTYLTVVMGELAPKALTLARAESIAVRVARPIALLSTVFHPVVWVLQGSARILLRPFGLRNVVAGDSIRSPEELREMIDEAEVSGVIPRAQEEMLHRIFEFAGREAIDVMRPAHDVAWLDASLTAGEAFDRTLEKPHARYPVGSGSLDRLTGVVHGREIAAAARSDEGSPIGALVQPALVVPETKDLGALLRELRDRRQQLAVVIDEYGKTVGIVTLEDILEEIVGDIEDEYDLPDDTLQWIADDTVLVAGSMTIDDFNEAVGTQLPTGADRTLAGLVFSSLGRRPEPNDTVVADAVRLSVEVLEGLRIKRLRVVVPGRAPR